MRSSHTSEPPNVLVERLYCIIMAGGRGERFWPLSTDRAPKPFVRLGGDLTMIQQTVRRALRLVPKEHILIVLAREHEAVARKQLPELGDDNFLVEPMGRDTAPCIAFASSVIRRRGGDAVAVVMPADHYIPDEDAFAETIRGAALWAADHPHLVTVGIGPTRPETGYGYINVAETLGGGGDSGMPCYKVARFVEKPDRPTAVEYLQDGRYFWNAGIFVWRVSVVLEGVKAHMPELHDALAIAVEAWGRGDEGRFEEAYKGLPRQSIDYGLMEKADNIVMVPARFLWDDVGTWTSLGRVAEGDENGNRVFGEAICRETRNSIIYDDGVGVAVLGMDDVVVIATASGVLVCHADKAQEVREVARLAMAKKSNR